MIVVFELLLSKSGKDEVPPQGPLAPQLLCLSSIALGNTISQRLSESSLLLPPKNDSSVAVFKVEFSL